MRRKSSDFVRKNTALKLAAAIRASPLLVVLSLGMCESSSYSQAPVGRGTHLHDGKTVPSNPRNALARAESAVLERHYPEAIKILSAALREHPGGVELELELGRAYLATGQDRKAQRLFRNVLTKESSNRWAQLELARVLAYHQHFKESDAIYRQLLNTNPADETAAIGLTSNFMHESRRDQAAAITNAALSYHPNSLRLLEYKDRIAQGIMGGEERALPIADDFVSNTTDYVNDSAGNHSWQVAQRLELRIKPWLSNDLYLEQQSLHSADDRLEVVETFTETVRWKPLERLAFTAGGGALHFDKGDVRAVYEATLSGPLAPHFLLGAGFSRIPIVPDAEAAERQLTAQGWEAFSLWTPTVHWRFNVRASRRHYSDENVGAHQWAEVEHQWVMPKMTWIAGCRYRHYGFSQDVAHGYFSPDTYHSYQATLDVVFRPNRTYRGEAIARAGAESISSRADFQAAWEMDVRNQVSLGQWELNLDYSRYHMAQVTGAFRADSARFEFGYRF